MIKNINEIFTEFSKAETEHDRSCVLFYNNSFALRSVLKGTFDPNVTFAFNVIPPYKKSDAPAGLGYVTIHQTIEKSYLFETNNPKTDKNLTQKRKEILLIQILEAMEPKEATIYENMILKDQKIPGLTYELVKKVFPYLLP